MVEHDATHALIAKALGLVTSAISEESTFGSPENWDSLGHMRILLEIEASIGHELDAEVAAEIMDVKSARQVLLKHRPD